MNVRKFVLCFAALVCAVQGVEARSAGPAYNVEGRVVDAGSSPVEYATVFLLTGNGEQAAGTVADGEGRFVLSVPAGEYTLSATCLGYADFAVGLAVSGDVDMGDIRMETEAEEVDAVVVTGRLITREADRFVVNVAESSVAVGKDAYEMIKIAPSVWATDDGITVNGRGGTRVMIDDRLLNMSGEDLEAYLRTINAEDIKKIEVIMNAGAEYDADSSGGIIKITMNKRRDDGLDGNVRLYGNYGVIGDYGGGGSAGINYQVGRLQVYANGGYGYDVGKSVSRERTVYSPENTSRDRDEDRSVSVIRGAGPDIEGRLGAWLDINDRHKVGAEFNIYSSVPENVTSSSMWLKPYYGEGHTGPVFDSVVTTSRYKESRNSLFIGGTFNYVYKMDDEGTTFKVIGDYSQSIGSNGNSYVDSYMYYTGASAMPGEDLRQKRDAFSDYKVASVNAAFDIPLSKTSRLQAGAKYTFDGMFSNMDYLVFGNGGWQESRDPERTDYTENIGALYAAYSARYGRFGLVAGLRYEYTFMTPRYTDPAGDGQTTQVKKRYGGLFPNVNLSYAFNEQMSNSLVLSYSRKISRPGFWALNPFETKLSPVSSVMGNPDLKPTYSNNIDLSLVLAYKYSISLGANLSQNSVSQRLEIRQVEEPGADGQMNEVTQMVYRYENIADLWQYYLAVNAPVTITPWWSLNANAVLFYYGEQFSADAARRDVLGVFGYLSSTFEIPKVFDLEINYWYSPRMLSANIEVMSQQDINVSIKKRMLDNRLTMSLTMYNLFDRKQRVRVVEEGFEKWNTVDSGGFRAALTIRYNFRSGKEFRARTVERDADGESQRISGGK